MRVRQIRKKAFMKNKQNFVCEVCDYPVEGDGYRNHCPQCLTSKHVDINPGDRDAECKGLMKVIDIELDHGKLVFTQECKCGHRRKNKAHPEDSIDAITTLMQDFAKKNDKRK